MEFIKEVFSNLWFQLFTIVLIATAHGYGAAWLAVRMLFRPHKAIRLFGLTIFPQGIIPRQRERLAIAIGKAVGDELVSHQTISDALFKTNFLRGKVETLINSFAEDFFNKNHGSILETLPPSTRNIALDAIANLQTKLGEHVTATLKSEETAEAVRDFVETQSSKLLSQRVSETLNDETYTQILRFLETRLRGILSEKALSKRIQDFVNERVEDAANTQTPLGELFTADFIGFARERLLGQIAPVVSQIAEIASSDRTREQIGALVKAEIGDYYVQLPFYQKFFVSRDKLYKEVDDLVNTTLPRKIEETLHGQAFAQEAEVFFNSTIDGLLSRPLPEIIGNIAPEKLAQLKLQISGTLFSLINSGEMQTSISAYLSDTLAVIRPHSWRAVVETVSPEAISRIKTAATNGLLQVLRRDETAATLNSILSVNIEKLLLIPIGRLSDFVSAETVTKINQGLTNQIVGAAEERLPKAIQEFDIGKIVREKVDAYPLEKLESLVLSIAGQHLQKIELFGLVIGFLLGVVQAALFWVFPQNR